MKSLPYTLRTCPAILQTWKHKAHQNICYQWISVVAFVNDSDCDAVKNKVTDLVGFDRLHLNIGSHTSSGWKKKLFSKPLL